MQSCAFLLGSKSYTIQWSFLPGMCRQQCNLSLLRTTTVNPSIPEHMRNVMLTYFSERHLLPAGPWQGSTLIASSGLRGPNSHSLGLVGRNSR